MPIESRKVFAYNALESTLITEICRLELPALTFENKEARNISLQSNAQQPKCATVPVLKFEIQYATGILLLIAICCI